MKVHLLIAITLGVVIGAVAMFAYIDSQRRDPVMSCSGRVQLDTASHEDLRLNNAIFIDNPGAPHGRIYLRFKEDKTMNDPIGKQVTVTGSLKSVKLDNGESITELDVEDIQYLP